MRKTTLVLGLVALAPLAAGAVAWTDPVGDEATFVGSSAGAKACHHPATDITRLEIDVQGSRLLVLLGVLNASGTWDCGGAVVIPAHSGTQRVAFQNCGEGCGSSLVLSRSWSTSATGEVTAEQCFTVDNSIPMGCRASILEGNTTVWSLPMKTSVYDLRGKCFADTFAESRTAPSVPQAGALLATTDTLVVGGTCL